MLQSGHLIVQLFEMREQVLKVIKDFSHGRLAAECGATSKRSKQQLKSSIGTPSLKRAIMSEMLGLNEDVVFSPLFCQSPPEKRFPPEEWRPGLKACFNKRTDTSIFVSER